MLQPPLAVNSNGWRPLFSSPEKSTLAPNSRVTTLQHPVLSKFQAHMVTAERTKRLQNAEPSSKVEMFALVPPTILGAFSLFGHATVKARDKKKNVAEHLIPPPVLQAESQQSFRYDRPQEVHRPSFYFQDPPKSKQFFPSEQIGEFPALYSTLGEAENFEPFYKTFSRTTTKFGEGDVKFLPQSVGIHVTSSTSFPQPGLVQDVPLHPTRLSSATGTQLPDHTYILTSSTPLTSFEDQVYVTTWPPQQYVHKPSLKPAEKTRNNRPYFQDTNKSRVTSFRVETENPFVQTQNPFSQTYIRKPAFPEQTTPSTQINEVRLRRPLLPTPVTEDVSETPRAPYVYSDNQNEYRIHQLQKVQLPTSPSEEEERSQVEVQAYQPRRPVSRRPAYLADTSRVRRPSYYQKQPVAEEVILRKRRPVIRNNAPEEEQKQRIQLPVSEELTTQPSETEPEDSHPTPLPLESSTFHSRKKVPLPDRARGRDRTRARTPRPITTEKPITESTWSSDDYAYDPELQNTSHDLNEPHTVNEIIDEFVSTKSGSQHTATSTTSTATSTTTTTTTSTTTTTPPTTTSRSRLRFPSNITRPRFSLRDHKERLERLSALTRKTINETRLEDSEATRSRNPPKESIKQEEDIQRSKVRQRDPPRGRQRPSTPTSTETTVSTEPSATSERTNGFKPANGRYRPGVNKYYGGYRSKTTELASDSETATSSTTPRTVVRPKPVFSATRKPFPLRTRPLRVSTSTTTTEQAPTAEEVAVSASEPDVIVTEADKLFTRQETLKPTDNRLIPAISEKADTTTTMDVEAVSPSTHPPSVEQDTMSPSQIVADLTSSANSGGYFSNRSNMRITMATEDPILPIEAFFPVRSNREVLS